MLRIEQIKSYKLPRYPQGLYYEHPDTRSRKIAGSIASAAVLALLVSSCKSGGEIEPPSSGMVGPPPMAPTMVTEREARTVIDEVFARNGIKLEADVPFLFSTGNQTSINLELDGFNKDLNIGYEYIYDEYKDLDSFTSEVIADIDKASKSNDKGPKIKTIQMLDQTAEEAHKKIEAIIEDFIADLHSRGII